MNDRLPPGGLMQATSLERAKAIYDVISGEARESELAGRLIDRMAQALLGANLFSMLVARSNGGLEASRETVARADGSAGWCLSVCATTAFVISKTFPGVSAGDPEVRSPALGEWLFAHSRRRPASLRVRLRPSGRRSIGHQVRF
jgi:hypothetical protein